MLRCMCCLVFVEEFQKSTQEFPVRKEAAYTQEERKILKAQDVGD